MKLCGLTGGVGMGKSTAAGFFLAQGARVIDTDQLARELVQPGQPALAEIQHQFGADMIGGDGQLRRDALARLVFADMASRRQLESILHPRIRTRWQELVAAWRAEQVAVAFVDIPLLYETRAEAEFDRVICVACTPESQRERLRARGWSDADIAARVAAQWPITQKIARADLVIWTEGSKASHQQQAASVFQRAGW